MSAVDRLTLLEQARDLLVASMTQDQSCPSCGAIFDGAGAGLPALVRELRAVLAEIEKIPGSGEVTPLDGIADGIADDLAARRRARAGEAG